MRVNVYISNVIVQKKEMRNNTKYEKMSSIVQRMRGRKRGKKERERKTVPNGRPRE